MPTMRATVGRDLNVAGRRYTAAAGETVDVHPDDTGRLEPFGFELEGEEGDDLEDVTLDELRRLARAADIRGRSTMTREELLEALRDGDPGQEI